jgi:hypothetical protein
MAEDLTTKVVDVRPTAVLNQKGGFAPGVAVDFMIGTHGPYTMQFNQEKYSAATAKAAIEQYAAEIRGTFI